MLQCINAHNTPSTPKSKLKYTQKHHPTPYTLPCCPATLKGLPIVPIPQSADNATNNAAKLHPAPSQNAACRPVSCAVSASFPALTALPWYAVEMTVVKARPNEPPSWTRVWNSAGD